MEGLDHTIFKVAYRIASKLDKETKVQVQFPAWYMPWVKTKETDVIYDKITFENAADKVFWT